jgi:hypothetical protein
MHREQKREIFENSLENHCLVKNNFSGPKHIYNFKLRDLEAEKNPLNESNLLIKNLDSNENPYKNLTCLSKEDQDLYFTVMSKSLNSPSLKPLCKSDSFNNDIQNLFYFNDSNDLSEEPIHKGNELKLNNNLNPSLVISRAESFYFIDTEKISAKFDYSKCEEIGESLSISKKKKKKNSNFFNMCFCK